MHTEHMTRVAIAYWNEQLGFRMFVYTGPVILFPDPDVYAFLANGCPAQILGMAMYQKTEKARKQGLVFVCDADRYPTMIHELGHIAGLAHDTDNIHSIMYPINNHRMAPYVESADRELLRLLYN